MKKLFFLTLLVLMSVSLKAQSLSSEMQKVYDACYSMSLAVGSANTAGLKSANDVFRKLETKEFNVRFETDDIPSLDGHFVWDEVFVDSLVAGRDVRKFAQQYAKSRSARSTSQKGNIVTKTYVARAESGAKFTFKCRGRQELSVIAEPGGMITLRIHDRTNDVWYNDDENVKSGQRSRTKIFDLPQDKLCVLEVEVINCSKNDISFVVISN